MKPTLAKIKLVKRLSQETPCFTATLLYDGKSYSVANRGNGGCNEYHPEPPLRELDEWAEKTLPLITECGGYPVEPPLPMSFETWTFCRAFGDDV